MSFAGGLVNRRETYQRRDAGNSLNQVFVRKWNELKNTADSSGIGYYLN